MVAVPDEQVADLRSFRIRRRGVKVEGFDQRPKGPVSLQLCRRSDVGLEPKSSGPVQHLSQKPGFPNPSLTLNERDLARALGGLMKQLDQ